MSHYEWERGTIVLPRAAVPAIRRALVARNNEIAQEALDIAQEVWKNASAAEKKDNHRSQLTLMERARAAYIQRHPYTSVNRDNFTVHPPALERAYEIMSNASYATGRIPFKQLAMFAGAQANEFSDVDATLTIDPKSNGLTWNSDGNSNRRYHDLGWLRKTMIAELDKVGWTRGTGGCFEGNNESAEDEGIGASTTIALGPVGLAEDPQHTRPFKMANGDHVTEWDIRAARERQWNAQVAASHAYSASVQQQGRRRTGQFDFKRNSAPTGYLR